MANPVDVGACAKCKEPMWMTAEAEKIYRRNHGTFYCTHGHPNYWPEGKTEADKLRDQLEAERRLRQRAEQKVAEKDDEARAAWKTATRERNRANGYKGHATRITKRAKAGVCPCCNRTFKQLAAHMANKHPEFTPIEIHEGEPTVLQ